MWPLPPRRGTWCQRLSLLNVPTRLGLPAPYQTPEEQMGLFKKMDENGDGSISYDEWLACFLSEIIAPVADA